MSVFSAAKGTMAPNAAVLVRTDSRVFTRDATAATMRTLWPDCRMLAKIDRPEKSQTQLFGDRSEKPGETDILFLPQADRRRPLVTGESATPKWLVSPPGVGTQELASVVARR